MVASQISRRQNRLLLILNKRDGRHTVGLHLGGVSCAAVVAAKAESVLGLIAGLVPRHLVRELLTLFIFGHAGIRIEPEPPF